MTNGITVLMPVYNAEKHLQEAIDSILNQTFTNIEFLIINDASTDSSVDIINSYKDPRIRLVHNEENLGITKTLNRGIEMASFELIARMDADDISYPNRLQKQFDYFQANPECALLSTWAREFITEEETTFIEKIKPEYYYYNLTFECWIYHPTVMYKRSAVMDVGKYSFPYAEDYDLWWRISRKYKIDNLSEVLLDYRSTNYSLSRITKKREYEEAHKEIMLRNIHYYTGTSLNLPFDEIEFLRSNLEPFIEVKSVKQLIRCFKKLSYITDCIIKKEGVNYKNGEIKKSADYKTLRTINLLREYFSKKEIFVILLRSYYWHNLLVFTKKELIRTYKSIR